MIEEEPWIEWNPVGCPVRPETTVEIMFRDGVKLRVASPETWNWGRSDREKAKDIVAYRKVKP